MSHPAAPEVKLVSHRARQAPALVGLLSVAALVLALAPGAQSSRAAVSQTIYAGFDADGNIKMNFADGVMIGTPSPPGTVVPAGTYQVVLNNNTDDDLAVLHKFHLFGPGVDVVGNSVQLTATVTFQPGATYVYQDDLHPDTLHEVFGTPGSGATSTSSSGSSGSSGSTGTGSTGSGSSGGKSSSGSQSAIGTALQNIPFRGTLAAIVSAGGRLTLTRSGKAVTTIKSGRYRFAVVDATAKGGFTVQEIRKQAVTLSGLAFVGKRTVTVDLKAGQWMFYSSSARKSYFVVIS